MKVLFLSAGLFLIIAFAFYNTITLTEYFKEVLSFNDEKCNIIDGPPGIEHMIQYGDYIIGGSDNHLQVSLLNNIESNTLPNGHMISMNTLSNTFSLLSIDNFPNDIPFHPHGISLFQNHYLYVINHSLIKGERIEVLKITNSPLTLHYERTILLPEEFNRITNDLVVIAKDEFYISTSTSMSRKTSGSIIKQHLFNYINFLSIAFRLKLTYVYHYKNNSMTQVPYSNAIFNNGVAYDKDNHLLYISQTMHKRIRVLKVNPKSDGDVQFIRDINLHYAANSISYDDNRGVLIAAIIGKVYHTIQLSKHYFAKGNIDIDEIYGGVMEINIKKGDEVSMVVLNKNKLKGVSCGIMLNGNIYLSSFADNGILICPIDKRE